MFATHPQLCHSERSRAYGEVEESTHFCAIRTQIGAKILRLASLAQDDILFDSALNDHLQEQAAQPPRPPRLRGGWQKSLIFDWGREYYPSVSLLG